jgi:hypothetical protein
MPTGRFLNYSYANDFLPGKSGMNSTIPANPNHLRGDFSDLLSLPNPAQYQIYDPLTTRPGPARPGHVIRDPFPNNVIPAGRILNPMYAKYIAFLPTPNVPIPAGVAPNNNYLGATDPDPVKSHVWGGRVDYNLSDANRLFFRGSGSHFLENAEDWIRFRFVRTAPAMTHQSATCSGQTPRTAPRTSTWRI